MIILFKHPCNDAINIKRIIPKKGSTKRRVDYCNGAFNWYFTNYDYHFLFEYRGNDNYSLFVCGGNVNDSLDWNSIDVQIIKK